MCVFKYVNNPFVYHEQSLMWNCSVLIQKMKCTNWNEWIEVCKLKYGIWNQVHYNNTVRWREFNQKIKRQKVALHMVNGYASSIPNIYFSKF